MTRLNVIISRVLLIGLGIAVALLLAGAVVTVARPGLETVHQASISAILGQIGGLEPAGFFALGLLLLIATPAIRVVALLVGFAREREWLFSMFSLVVLVLLALSAYLGFGG